jgi:hypothetical protein
MHYIGIRKRREKMSSSFNICSSDEQQGCFMAALKELTLKLRDSGIEIAPLEGDRASMHSEMTFMGFEYPLPGVKMAVFEAATVDITQNGRTVSCVVPEEFRKIQIVVLDEEDRLY